MQRVSKAERHFFLHLITGSKVGGGVRFLHTFKFKARPVTEVGSVRSRGFPRLVSKTGRELRMRARLPLTSF